MPFLGKVNHYLHDHKSGYVYFMPGKALKVMKNILDATSIQDAWQEMCKFMSEYGFDRLMYGRTHFAEGFNLGDEQDYMILSNHDPEYFDFFVRSGRFKRSPFFIWTFTNVGFISWSQLAALQLQDKIKTEALRIVERNQEYGVSEVVPSIWTVLQRF